MEDQEEGIAYLEKYLEDFPQGGLLAEVYLHLGQYYYSREDYFQAREYFNTLMEKMPDGEEVPEAYYWIAWSYFNQKDYQMALQMFKKVGGKFWGEDAQFRVGECLYELGMWEEAGKAYASFLKNYSESQLVAEAFQKKASTLYERGKLKAALDEFQKVLDREEAADYIKVHSQFVVGEIYEALGDYSKACYEFLKVVYLYPSYEDFVRRAYLKAGELLEKEEKWLEAKKIYTKLLRFPDKKSFAQGKILELIYKIETESKE